MRNRPLAATSGAPREDPDIDPFSSVAPEATCSRTRSKTSNLIALRVRRSLRIGLSLCAFLATFWVGWIGGSSAVRMFNQNDSESTAGLEFSSLVERIISTESNGGANKKNRHSSATGPAQFRDQTWLEMIAAHRPDLVDGRTRTELLELRRDQELAREITTRLVERNAKMLGERKLPITPGTLYLAHFAGPAGAVAVLSVPDNEHAASTMAVADATGRTTAQKIVASNPFLADFTVADLKRWADRKMRSADVREVPSPQR
jgi:hypothetical protein